MKNNHKIYFIFIVLAFISCKHEVNKEIQVDENLIEISKQQFQSENMAIGKAEKTEIKEKITFTGKIVPTSKGIAKISVPVPGKITSTYVKDGEYIEAQAPILSIGGSELIDLQHAFASTAAKIEQLKPYYEKVKQLFDEAIKTENEYLLAESNYKVELAKYKALEIKLQNIGLNLTDIKNGKYASSYSLKSPISGQASDIKLVRGQQVNTDTEILEIIDHNKSELKISLFEKDYEKTKVGQKVEFWGFDNKMPKSLATIDRMSAKLNSNSNTIDGYASIAVRANTYAINQIVNGEIITSSDTVFAIPATAILTTGNNHYVLIKKLEDKSHFLFEKKKISLGKSSGDAIEVFDLIDEEILIKGTYNISLE